jgi:diadenosine tetraphosphatase ApaH/serine/threonine PP2A family protein phosphatase
MTTAVLYDIHGNLPALEAVLADAQAADASAFVLGGDYSLFGAWPSETLARLRALPEAIWIRGNGERWTAYPTQAPDLEVVQDAIGACRSALGDEAVHELAGLPEQEVVAGVRFCHASPLSDVRGFGATAAAGGAGEDVELLAGAIERRVVFGHTHIQFRRPGPAGIDLVNPGSVGMPFDGDPRAAYLLVRERDQLELRRVAYEHELAATEVCERFGDSPFTRTVATRIRQARFDP